MFAFALQQLKTKYCSGDAVFTTRGCVWPMKTLEPDYLAHKQFSKTADGSDDFARACVCVEFFTWVIPYCLRLFFSVCACVDF